MYSRAERGNRNELLARGQVCSSSATRMGLPGRVTSRSFLLRSRRSTSPETERLPELIDEVCEGAMAARERRRLHFFQLSTRRPS
jgi:hypothetical protein